MSDSFPTIINITATSIVLRLPELMELIGQHLSVPTLFYSVCRTWNQTLIPLLWQTINTRSTGWGRIFDEYRNTDRSSQQAIEQSVRFLFAKYGQHIRHLTVRSRLVLDALSTSGKCTRLCSFVVGDVEHMHIGSFSSPPTATSSTTTTTTTTTATALGNVQLSWFESENNSDTPEKRAERQVIEQFWALVQQNPGLVRVRTPSLEEMNSLSETFILSTLKSLEYLRDLGMDDSQSRMWTLFRSLPKLERWDKYIRGDTLWNWKPKERFTNLRSLSLRFYVLVGEIFRILEYLPNVEELRIGGTPSQSMEYAMIMKRELPLKVLHVDKVLHYEDRFVAVLVRQCPQLLHFRSREVLKMTRQALWENCYSLESIDSARHVSVIPWRQRRLEDARRKQAQ